MTPQRHTTIAKRRGANIKADIEIESPNLARKDQRTEPMTDNAPTTRVTTLDFQGHPIRLAWDKDHLVLSLDDLCAAVGAKKPTADAVDADIGDLYEIEAGSGSLIVVTRYIAGVIANTRDGTLAKTFKSWLYAVAFPATQSATIVA